MYCRAQRGNGGLVSIKYFITFLSLQLTGQIRLSICIGDLGSNPVKCLSLNISPILV